MQAPNECTIPKLTTIFKKFKNITSKIIDLGMSHSTKPLFAPFPSPYPPTSTDCVIGWNSSKKPSAKYVKCNECASSADMPSRKQTRVRRGFCRHMIQQEKEEDMERWRVRGRKALSVLLAHTKMGMERSALAGVDVLCDDLGTPVFLCVTLKGRPSNGVFCAGVFS